MRAVTLWTIAGTLAALAIFVSADEKDKEKMDLLKKMSGCCRTTKGLLSVFQYGGITCGSRFLFKKMTTYFRPKTDPTSLAPDLRDGCLVQCIYDQNNFLNTDLSIKEEKLKKKMLKEIEGKHDDVKPVVETALTKCFQLIHNNEANIQAAADEEAKKKGLAHAECKQAPQLVLTCIAGYTLLNCPQSDWRDDHIDCTGKRESLKQDIMNLEGQQVAELQKNDPNLEISAEDYSKMGLVMPKVTREKTEEELAQEHQEHEHQEQKE